jgi:hypothetical protein
MRTVGMRGDRDEGIILPEAGNVDGDGEYIRLWVKKW